MRFRVWAFLAVTIGALMLIGSFETVNGAGNSQVGKTRHLQWVHEPTVSSPEDIVRFSQSIGEALPTDDFPVSGDSIRAVTAGGGSCTVLDRATGEVRYAWDGLSGGTAVKLIGEYWVSARVCQGGSLRVVHAGGLGGAAASEDLTPAALLEQRWLPVGIEVKPSRLFIFRPEDGKDISIPQVAGEKGRVAAVVLSGTSADVVCFDLEEGDVCWTYRLDDLGEIYVPTNPLVFCNGVLNLAFSHGPKERPDRDVQLALSVESDRVLLRNEASDNGLRRLVTRAPALGALIEWRSRGVRVVAEKDKVQLWQTEAPAHCVFGSKVLVTKDSLYLPFETSQTYRKGKDELLRRATHGILVLRLADGEQQQALLTDCRVLPGAPVEGVPRWIDWSCTWNGVEGIAPISTEDYILFPPVRLEWDHPAALSACAVLVGSRHSGEVLDVLWTRPVKTETWLNTGAWKMVLDGNQLFLLTRDGRLWCFDLSGLLEGALGGS